MKGSLTEVHAHSVVQSAGMYGSLMGVKSIHHKELLKTLAHFVFMFFMASHRFKFIVRALEK